MIFKLLKRMIVSGNYEKADMADKLDIYFLFGRLSREEYEELSALMKR